MLQKYTKIALSFDTDREKVWTHDSKYTQVFPYSQRQTIVMN